MKRSDRTEITVSKIISAAMAEFGANRCISDKNA